MNAAPVDGMQNLPADQQQKLLTKIDEMQVRDRSVGKPFVLHEFDLDCDVFNVSLV